MTDELSAARRDAADRLIADELDTKATDRLTRKILAAVRDPEMHPSTAAKAAAAVASGKLSVHHVRELLEAIDRNRRTIDRPGAYFCACLKRLFQRHEIPWR